MKNYSIDYRKGFVFQNNLKNLDLSYKTDLDLWVCSKFIGLFWKTKKSCLITAEIW